MFVRGVDNKMADALTRRGYEFSPTVQHFETELEKPGSHEINVYLLGSAHINSVSLVNREDILTSLAKNLNYFVEYQQINSSLASIVTELQKNPDHYNKKSDPKHHKEHFKLSRDGVVLRASKNNHWQIVVPSSLLLQVLQLGHDNPTSGHQSAERTLQQISDYFWWPKMNHDVTEYVKTCKECGTRNPQGPNSRAPIFIRPSATEPFVHIETDIKGPVPRSRFGYNSILVIEDRFSKFAEMCPLRDQGTDQVCRELRKWIGRYGVSLKLHSDNGPRFISTEFQNFLDRYGTEHSYSTAYRPQANGSVERLNRTMGTMLSKLVTKNPRDWPDYLPEVH